MRAPGQHASLLGGLLRVLAGDDRPDTKPLCDLGCGEWPVRSGKTGDQIAQRVIHRLGKRGRHPDGQRDAQPVA